MIGIILNGAAGRMGAKMISAVEACDDVEIAAKIDPSGEGCLGSIDDYEGSADCVVDFSYHSSAPALCEYCVRRGLPLVIATTGQTADEKATINEAAGKIPIFFAPNMSLGIAVISKMAKDAASAFPDAEVEIVEVHHDQKLDVPSGTALALADSVRDARPGATINVGRHQDGKRTSEEIGIHSLRLGNLVGIHEVIVSTGFETISIKHEAHDRALFADGAIAAARFIVGQPAGLYGMEDIVG